MALLRYFFWLKSQVSQFALACGCRRRRAHVRKGNALGASAPFTPGNDVKFESSGPSSVHDLPSLLVSVMSVVSVVSVASVASVVSIVSTVSTSSHYSWLSIRETCTASAMSLAVQLDMCPGECHCSWPLNHDPVLGRETHSSRFIAPTVPVSSTFPYTIK